MFEAEGIVLSRRKIDSQNIYMTLLTRNLGKIEVYAKGAMNPKSPINKGAQPFVFGVFTIRGNKSYTLSGVEVNDAYYSLREDLEKLAYASYAVSLVSRVLPEGESNKRVYELLVNCIHLLDRGVVKRDIVRTYLELSILKLLGVGPETESCISCGSASDLRFSISGGGAVCTSCMGEELTGIDIGVTGINFFTKAKQSDIRTFMKLEMDTGLLKKLEPVIDSYYLYHLDIDIKAMKKQIDFYNGL